MSSDHDFLSLIFLANLGGYLGLAVGASVLSFVEIFYFLLKLLGIFLRTYPEKK